jgi:hypothetical protein
VPESPPDKYVADLCYGFHILAVTSELSMFFITVPYYTENEALMSQGGTKDNENNPLVPPFPHSGGFARPGASSTEAKGKGDTGGFSGEKWGL